MRTRRILPVVVCLGLSLLWAGPAAAQFQYRPSPQRDPATGEQYNVEISGDLWYSTPQMTFSSEALGIAGSEINGVTDLGFTKKRFPEFKVVLRPALKHKFRLQFTPV